MNYNAVVCVVKSNDDVYGEHYSELNCNMDSVHEWFDDDSEIFNEYDNKGRLIHSTVVVSGNIDQYSYFEYDDNDNIIRYERNGITEETTYDSEGNQSTAIVYYDDNTSETTIYFKNDYGFLSVDNELNLRVTEFDEKRKLRRIRTIDNTEIIFKRDENGKLVKRIVTDLNTGEVNTYNY